MPFKVGVIGAGRMGVSLAHLNGLVGLETVLKVRPGAGRLARARDALAASHAREVQRGRQTEDEAQTALARVRITQDYPDLAQSEIVIEAIHEDVMSKRRVLAEAEALVEAECVFASSTSSIPARMLAEGLRRPDRMIVTHYIWPAHQRTMVEMAVPDFVDSRAVRRIHTLLKCQGKTAFIVPDRPGFVTTRALLAYLSESIYLVRDGASPTKVDGELEAFGWPMGPCRLMDTLGLRNAGGLHGFLRPFQGVRLDGLALLEPGIRSGYLGHPSGQGFYRRGESGWTVNQAMVDLIRSPGSMMPTDEEIVDRTVGMMLNELAHCIAEGVIPDWRTAGCAIDGAFDFPSQRGGLLGYLTQIGVQQLRARLLRFEETLGPRFSSPDLARLPMEAGGGVDGFV